MLTENANATPNKADTDATNNTSSATENGGDAVPMVTDATATPSASSFSGAKPDLTPASKNSISTPTPTTTPKLTPKPIPIGPPDMADLAQSERFERMLLESNTVHLLRALFTTTAQKYKFPLRGAINVHRLDATIKCSLKFQARGKPYHTSLAYIRKEDHDVHRNVPILEDPTFLDVNVNNNDVFVLCAILPGTVGKSLSDTTVDTARALALNRGYTIRDKKQVFPLMEILARHMKDKRERVLTLQKQVLDTVNGLFGELRPGGDAEDTTAGETKAKAKPAVQHDNVQIWDVACDRTDERCADHFGNRRFAVIVCIFMAKNFDLLRQDVRHRVAAQVLRIIEEGNPSGRFLRKTARGTWKHLSQDSVIEGISSFLKTAAEDAEEKRNRQLLVDTTPTEHQWTFVGLFLE